MSSQSGQEKSGFSSLDTEANLRSRCDIDAPTSTTPPSVPSHNRLSPVLSISNAGFGPLLPHTTDRVFPIHSVVNIEPRKHAAVSSGGTTRSSASSTPANEGPFFKDDSSSHSVFGVFRSGSINDQDGHMIVTGINGPEAIQACEDEPIHIPGAVQGFGCLVAFTELDDGILDIRVVSEIGYLLSLEKLFISFCCHVSYI